MLMKNTITKNYIYNVIYQLIAIIIPLITTPYVSRILQVDGIGAYSYGLSVVTYFGMFGTLGIASYGQLQIAKVRDNIRESSRNFWEIFFARLLTMTFSSIIYILMALFSEQYKKMFLVLIIYLISQIFDISWYFQGREEFNLTVFRNLCVKIVSTILIFIVVKTKNDLYKYAFILNLSTFLGNISLWLYLKERVLKIKILDLNIFRHWKNSIVFFIPAIATSVYTVLDKSMIGWFTNSAFENGYYEQAHKIELIIITIVTSLGTVTMPRMTYLYKNKLYDDIEKIMSITFKFIICISFPMMFGLIMIAPNMIPWFLGEGYDKCIVLLQIFSLLVVIVGLNNTIGKQCLMATGRLKYYNKGVICGAIVNLCVNLLLIPKFDSIGAAIGSVIAEFVILIYFLYYSREYFRITDYTKLIGKYLISSVVMSVVVYMFGKVYIATTIGIIIQIITGIITYALCLIMVKDELIFFMIDKVLMSKKKKIK